METKNTVNCTQTGGISDCVGITGIVLGADMESFRHFSNKY